jgi:hypothetical protein
MKRTGIYISKLKKNDYSNNKFYDKKPFTDFEKINQKTNLRNLNFDWSEKDLPERTRTKHVHRLHPYLGKFIPQIPRDIFKKV